ncbi:hypothetical protein [Micromonospora sp. NBC_01412]|uniref:hypothetical protein n=1 Tax=Micromonospora sp. NBC_01412 TaxID=2903590 RepID=UPI00386CCC59
MRSGIGRGDQQVQGQLAGAAVAADEQATDAHPARVAVAFQAHSRKSHPRPCAELIIAAGITRVVLALREPPLFVTCHGVELLQTAGAEVIEIPEIADQVRAINAHLPGIGG